MRSCFLLLICLLAAVRVFAQDNKPYAEKATQLQTDVWGTEEPEFKATTAPEN